MQKTKKQIYWIDLNWPMANDSESSSGINITFSCHWLAGSTTDNLSMTYIIVILLVVNVTWHWTNDSDIKDSHWQLESVTSKAPMMSMTMWKQITVNDLVTDCSFSVIDCSCHCSCQEGLGHPPQLPRALWRSSLLTVRNLRWQGSGWAGVGCLQLGL